MILNNPAYAAFTLCASLWTIDALADDSDPLCGINCLYVALCSLEINAGNYSDFLKQHGDVDARGVSLGEMGKIAEGYGAHTLAVQTSLENLLARKGRFACIAHIDGRHFVNVQSIESTRVMIIDPPHTGELAKGIFLKRWNGKALLVSARPLQREEDISRRSPYWLWFIFGTISLVVVGGAAWRCMDAKPK